ncbi:MAG: TetR/AcrR family transcriptional regulator [Sandaracinaceae bacterium]
MSVNRVHKVNVVHGSSVPGIGKRAARRQARTAQIVDAAFTIVTEEGFEALTMKRLATELGFATGAVYRYFAGKDELLLAVQARVLAQLTEDIRDAADRAASEGSLVALLAAARVYLSFPERRPAAYRLLARWLGNPDPMVATDLAAPAVAEWMERFQRVPLLFAEATAEGAMRAGDPAQRTLVLWSSIQGLHQLRKLGRFEVPALQPESLAEALIVTLLLGWGTAPDRAADAWARAGRVSEGLGR